MGSRRRPTLSTYGVSCSVTTTELTQLRKRGLTQTDVACPGRLGSGLSLRIIVTID
jgi:hypothetical protein